MLNAPLRHRPPAWPAVARLVLSIGLAAAGGAAVSAPLFRIALASGAPGQTGCQIEAFNDLGQVAGRCDQEGFVWDPVAGAQAIRDPAHPDASVFPTSINNLGVVAGSRWAPGGANPGFVWTAAAGFDYFGTHERVWDPRAINDAGVVAGHSMARDDPEFVWKAFRWTAEGGVQPVKPSANRRTVSSDINAAGQIAGSMDWLPQGGTRAVRFEPGGGVTRLVPGTHHSYSAALNDAGEVVGAMWNGAQRFQAFLWRPDTGAVVIDPRTGRHDDSGAQDVNGLRQVVGLMNWEDADGNTQEAAFYRDDHTEMTDLLELIDPADPLRPRVAQLWPALVRINAAGQVAVNAYGTADERLLLVLTPVAGR